MNLQAFALSIPPMLMLLLGLIPDRIANRCHATMRKLVISLVGLACFIAFGCATNRLSGLTPPTYDSLVKATWTPHLEFSVYYDNLTALMLCLVSFLGLVTCRFSVRYMDGEQSQGQYYKWMSFTIGAISLMVVAGNLLMFLLAWFNTSVGLHQLLTHYSHRPQAKRAAWTKFAFSRLGDLLLLIAIILLIQVFESQALPDIIDKSKQLMLTPDLLTQQHAIIVWLLVFGAAIKTVQVPFHAWLPETLETPTPVSALMHAGVVNAGGYLLVRINPVLALETRALAALAIIGTATACLGVVVMATQTSVKRSLAYSTVAQMGFMMLQCGIGAFSAAMLHILAHSLYKAYAFLGSGSVDFQSKRNLEKLKSVVPLRYRAVYLAGAMAYSAALVLCFSGLFQMDLWAKQGGIVLSFILILALSSWSWKLFLCRQIKTQVFGLIVVAGICAASLGSFQWIDSLVGGSVVSILKTPGEAWLSLLIFLAFGMLFLMHVVVASGWRQTWLERIRIHAVSGFYISSIYQRVFSNILAS